MNKGSQGLHGVLRGGLACVLAWLLCPLVLGEAIGEVLDWDRAWLSAGPPAGLLGP
jgi:hypothetical protein